jgi:hypothetical protein
MSQELFSRLIWVVLISPEGFQGQFWGGVEAKQMEGQSWVTLVLAKARKLPREHCPWCYSPRAHERLFTRAANLVGAAGEFV